MADFRAAGNAIGNSGKGPKRVIFLIIVLVILIFVFRHKIADTYHNVTQKVSETFEEVKGKFGTPVLEDGPTGGNVDKVEEVSEEDEKVEEYVAEVIYVITESSVNIREDAGVDYKQITTANKGDEFIGTGNEKEASNGRPWYEIYLNDEKTETGWVSSKVAKPKE